MFNSKVHFGISFFVGKLSSDEVEGVMLDFSHELDNGEDYALFHFFNGEKILCFLEMDISEKELQNRIGNACEIVVNPVCGWQSGFDLRK